MLIINADDFGRSAAETDTALRCYRAGRISSVSAMVFMEDSERAARLAKENGLDIGLHLNFSERFTGKSHLARLSYYHNRIVRFLRRTKYSQLLYNPFLRKGFSYSYQAQADEFARLLGRPPSHIDGHHHMHLCANVVLKNLLPAGTVVRRNSSFERGEKGFCNRMYRSIVDRLLERRHDLPDFLFLLPPLEPRDRLEKIFSLAHKYVVEIETHPVNADEYQFLMEGEIFQLAGDVPVASSFAMPQRKCWQRN